MMQFDDIFEDVGEFGKFQKRLLLLVIFPQVLISIQALLPVFVLSNHEHQCRETNLSLEVMSEDINDTVYMNNVSTPITTVSQCMLTRYYNSTNTTASEKCSSWVFDKGAYSSTPISDFNLVCDNAILKTHASMMFMGGNLCGSILMGILGDTYGRKPVMFLGGCILFGSSLACAWSINFTMYMVLRFLSGTGTIMCITSAMIIVFELVGPSHRALVSVVVELAWCVGELVLCGAAYLLRDWTHLQIVVSCPGALLLLYWLLMPESARWLLSKGKTSDAMKLVSRIAKTNQRPFHTDITAIDIEHRKSMKEFLPLFKSCTLVIRLLIVVFCWFVIAISYYGLSFNVGRIGDNVYLDFFINTLFEAVAYIACLYINTRFGRKKLNIVAFLLAGFACLAAIFTALYSDKLRSNEWIAVALPTIGRMGVSAVFANIFIYSGELFPTTTRSFILSISNVGGRIGAAIAPYITDLGILVGSDFGSALPTLVFGVLALLAGLFSCFLPETFHTTLPDNIKNLKKGNSRLNVHPVSSKFLSTPA